jgi:aldose 1-epimerase
VSDQQHTILTLENASQRVGILPQLGGSFACWDVKRDGEWQAIWRRYAPPVGDNRTVGSFPLVPFSNRITGGGFTCDGVFYPMERNRSNCQYPIHGNGWMHEWDVVEHSANVIELAVESRKMHGYPWEYAARQRFSLDGDVMTMRLEVTHLGEKRLPYGLAFHPFQLRGDNANGPRLQFKADGYWIASEDCIPQEHSTALPADYDFNTLRDLGHGKIDNNFTGWDGHMVMERPDIDLRIEWSTTEPAGIDHSVLFRPEGQPFFCFEPITHITDAINREGMPGMRLLEKGQSLALEVKQVLSRIG